MYDDFAFLVFEDESVVLAFRPVELGGMAVFNTKLSEDGSKGYLFYKDKNMTIQYYDIVPDSSQ